MIQTKNITAALSIFFLSLIIAAYADGATVKRSNFTVANLACTSCLAAIEAELQGMDGALGMAADLRRGRIIVDHLDTLSHEQIAATISRLGYPAAMEWTATLPGQYSNRYAMQNLYRLGYSSGGFTDRTGTGPATWKIPPEGSTVTRTTLRVGNLSCASCLSNIAAVLAKLSNTYGMKGYLSRGIVIVDHAADLESSRIAAVISGLGYPAKAMATNYIPAQKAFAPNPGRNSRGPGVRQGSGCGSKGTCNATAESWQKLYNRYFSRTNQNNK